MASPSSSKFEPAIIEQVITEFFAKSVHIILESRSPYVSSRNYSADPFISFSSSSSPSPSFRPRDKWFNLALRDCPAALENFDLWRQSNLEPLVVDIFLTDRKSACNPSYHFPSGIVVRNFFSGDRRSEKIVERWLVHYDYQSSSWLTKESSYQGRKKGTKATPNSSEFQVRYKKAYRRITVLLRSLYTAVRLLPAYKLFRDLTSSSQIHPSSLSHRISSFVEPFSHLEDPEMDQLEFGPLETFFGRLSLSVCYLKKIEVLCSESFPPMPTQFILDYVGSPLAYPLKRIQSLSCTESTRSCDSLSRRHSWSNDYVTPSFSSTPSPPYSDFHAMNFNVKSYIPPPHYFQDNSSPLCSLPSQSFSPSFTSSQSHSRQSSVHSESTPVRIPMSGKRGHDEGHSQVKPHPYYISKMEGPFQVDIVGSQPSSASTTQSFSHNNKLLLKNESLRMMEMQIGMQLPKNSSSEKGTAGNMSIFKISSYTSHIPSRSTSRVSFMDEIDDSGLDCPFADDYEEITNSCRDKSTDFDLTYEKLNLGELIPIKRSSDAAIGALVRMLQTAPPLQLINSDTLIPVPTFRDEGFNINFEPKKENDEKGDASLDVAAASKLPKPKTTADALEELQAYKHMREMILREDESHAQDIENDTNSKSHKSAQLQ